MENLGIECKKLMVKEFEEKLKASPNLFLTSFNSLAVAEQDELRRKLKEIDASYFVVKNRLAKRVLDQLNLKTLTPLMQELTAIALGGPDPICLSKALINFASKSENFKILGGYVDEQVLPPNSIKRLAAIPSREVLLSQILSGFKSPIQGMVNTLSAVMRNFVVVLDKIREKSKKED